MSKPAVLITVALTGIGRATSIAFPKVRELVDRTVARFGRTLWRI